MQIFFSVHPNWGAGSVALLIQLLFRYIADLLFQLTIKVLAFIAAAWVLWDVLWIYNLWSAVHNWDHQNSKICLMYVRKADFFSLFFFNCIQERFREASCQSVFIKRVQIMSAAAFCLRHYYAKSKGCFWVTRYKSRSIYKDILSVTVLWLKAVQLLVFRILILNFQVKMWNWYMILQHSEVVSSINLNLSMEISVPGSIFPTSSKLVESLNCLILSFFSREVPAPLHCAEWCYLYNIKELKMTSFTIISAKTVRSTIARQSMGKLIFINVDFYECWISS